MAAHYRNEELAKPTSRNSQVEMWGKERTSFMEAIFAKLCHFLNDLQILTKATSQRSQEAPTSLTKLIMPQFGKLRNYISDGRAQGDSLLHSSAWRSQGIGGKPRHHTTRDGGRDDGAHSRQVPEGSSVMVVRLRTMPLETLGKRGSLCPGRNQIMSVKWSIICCTVLYTTKIEGRQ